MQAEHEHDEEWSGVDVDPAAGVAKDITAATGLTPLRSLPLEYDMRCLVQELWGLPRGIAPQTADTAAAAAGAGAAHDDGPVPHGPRHFPGVGARRATPLTWPAVYRMQSEGEQWLVSPRIRGYRVSLLIGHLAQDTVDAHPALRALPEAKRTYAVLVDRHGNVWDAPFRVDGSLLPRGTLLEGFLVPPTTGSPEGADRQPWQLQLVDAVAVAGDNSVSAGRYLETMDLLRRLVGEEAGRTTEAGQAWIVPIEPAEWRITVAPVLRLASPSAMATAMAMAAAQWPGEGEDSGCTGACGHGLVFTHVSRTLRPKGLPRGRFTWRPYPVVHVGIASSMLPHMHTPAAATPPSPAGCLLQTGATVKACLVGCQGPSPRQLYGIRGLPRRWRIPVDFPLLLECSCSSMRASRPCPLAHGTVVRCRLAVRDWEEGAVKREAAATCCVLGPSLQRLVPSTEAEVRGAVEEALAPLRAEQLLDALALRRLVTSDPPVHTAS